jgi:hypothetical protein
MRLYLGCFSNSDEIATREPEGEKKTESPRFLSNYLFLLGIMKFSIKHTVGAASSRPGELEAPPHEDRWQETVIFVAALPPVTLLSSSVAGGLPSAPTMWFYDENERLIPIPNHP